MRGVISMRVSIFIFIMFTLSSVSVQEVWGARIKDVVKVKGVRENILIGYGLVVGLRGTGDSSGQTAGRALRRMLKKMGMDSGANVESKNVASVVVTAKLPPFARAGQKIDITISSVGDAASLSGGTLLTTPLRAGDQKVYAVAQGSVSLGTTSETKETFGTVGWLPSGATVERELKANFSNKKSIRLHTQEHDFTTIARVARRINMELGGKYATTVDGNTVDLIVPFSFKGNAVELMAVLENLTVNTSEKAKIVINEKTGTIVAGGKVRIKSVALSHGDLSIQIEDKTRQLSSVGKKVIEIQESTSVSELVKALNTIGVGPKDLTAIFQALKKSGALEGELEIF